MRGVFLPLTAVVLLTAPGNPVGTLITPAATDTVAIRLFQFQPDTLDIPAGSAVTWTNGDNIEHTVTAGVPDSVTGNFNGKLAARGAVWSRKFERAGTYPYFCSRHPSMRGAIRVTTTGGN